VSNIQKKRVNFGKVLAAASAVVASLVSVFSFSVANWKW